MIRASSGRLPAWTLAAALVWCAALSGAQAEIDGDTFVSPAWHVRVTAPKSWQLTEKTAYPNLLLRMVRRAPDGMMLLSAERLPSGEDALHFARRTAALLRTMGFALRAPQLHASTGAYILDSQRDQAFLRQAFLVAGGVGYSLTLSAPDRRTRSQHLRAFDAALRSIEILPASGTTREPSPAGAPDDSPVAPSPPPPDASHPPASPHP